MEDWLTFLLAGLACAVSGYLIGSVCFAIPIGHMFLHTDIRTVGSGNAGLTNVIRNAGVGAAALTLIGDFGKAYGTVFLGRWLFTLISGGDGFYGGYIAGVFIVVGHILPLWFGFKGGKGVLAAAGMLLALEPTVCLMTLIVFGIVLLISGIVSLSSLAAAVAFPIITHVYLYLTGDELLIFKTCAAFVIAVVIIIMHRQNIKRLLMGTEKKLTLKKSSKNQERPQ